MTGVITIKFSSKLLFMFEHFFLVFLIKVSISLCFKVDQISSMKDLSGSWWSSWSGKYSINIFQSLTKLHFSWRSAKHILELQEKWFLQSLAPAGRLLLIVATLFLPSLAILRKCRAHRSYEKNMVINYNWMLTKICYGHK